MPQSQSRSVNGESRVRIPFRQRTSMVAGYVRGKLADQVKAIAFLVLYLAGFQLLVLRRPLADALGVSLGIGLVVAGLALFLEGLFLGVMPLGERCGLRLPTRVNGPWIVLFSLILGIAATLAEPAIGFLRAQGSAVTAWDAPLLYLLLNRGSPWLVAAVAAGVGVAVVLGVFRFIRGWSLRPFLFVLIPLLLGLSLVASLDPATASVVGLAWDTGGVTTGPVTVPLVIALGIGVSRIVGRGEGSSGGLGVVTLASALPVLAVLCLSFVLAPFAPAPSDKEAFFSSGARDRAIFVLGSEESLRGLARESLSPESFAALFDDAAAGAGDPVPAQGDGGSDTAIRGTLSTYLVDALKAILPLALVLIVTLRLLLRERISNADEVFLGLAFAVVGMFLFGIGMERGLNVLGREAGRSLPQAYTAEARPDRVETFRGVQDSMVLRASGPDGAEEYLPVVRPGGAEFVPFDRNDYDAANGTYRYVPIQRPILAGTPRWTGYAVVLLFVFIMGFGATLAEPSLSALGTTLEELTTGTYKRAFLVKTVAVGVGFGMAAGFARILLDLPLLAVIGVPYVLALVLTAFSSDEFVGIAWDSAGVTTGPITVPLVIAAGLGIGEQAPVIESFGVVAAASVVPVLTVLASGLAMRLKARRSLDPNIEDL